MLVEYKNMRAKLIYCAKTKSYHGEILGLDECLMFQATNRQQAIIAMQSAVDDYLAQEQDLT